MFKNINITKNTETIIPIYFIEKYENIKNVIHDYKFKNIFNINTKIMNPLLDIIINNIIDIFKYRDIYQIQNKINIVFTHPPSTMFYKKEKNIDSVNFLLKNAHKILYSYFKHDSKNIKIYFKSIININSKYIKGQNAQHFQNRKNRLFNIENKYYINIFNKMFINKICKPKNVFTIIYIIDDISSTGSTLFSCHKQIKDFMEEKKYTNTKIFLYSLAH